MAQLRIFLAMLSVLMQRLKLFQENWELRRQDEFCMTRLGSVSWIWELRNQAFSRKFMNVKEKWAKHCKT